MQPLVPPPGGKQSKYAEMIQKKKAIANMV